MSQQTKLYVFGEVLFDCFPDGTAVLGGAPFNVAWHLAALGDAPWLVSRIGEDELGTRIEQAMSEWGMTDEALQRDAEHPTGRVAITLQDGDASYDIEFGAAYDYIDPAEVPAVAADDVLYHGSLAIRHDISRSALDACLQSNPRVFLDVNLRDPWWQNVPWDRHLRGVHWAKMNEHELAMLGFDHGRLRDNMRAFCARHEVAQLIVTRGGDGALVLDQAGHFHEAGPPPVEKAVDTVGAGDSFSAIYLHGLLQGWDTETIIDRAQQFALEIIAIRGATSKNRDLYRPFQ